MCRDRRGCSHFALDRMKQQASVWRESYRPRVGAKRARWWVDGKRGNRPDCRLKRKRSCKDYLTGSRLGLFSIPLSWSFVAVDSMPLSSRKQHELIELRDEQFPGIKSFLQHDLPTRPRASTISAVPSIHARI